jgi:hypothetical protein
MTLIRGLAWCTDTPGRTVGSVFQIDEGRLLLSWDTGSDAVQMIVFGPSG